MQTVISTARTAVLSLLPTLQDELDDLVEKLREDGVDLSVDYNASRHSVYLDYITRNNKDPGSGAEALHSLCTFCDYYDMDIRLQVLDGEPKLMSLYRRFGFYADPDEDHEVFRLRPRISERN
jgi:hypothetical protein